MLKKSAAAAIISCFLEKNDSENADEYFESSNDKGIEDFTENSDIPLKFVNENALNLAVNDACNRDKWLDNEAESEVSKCFDVEDSGLYSWKCSQLDFSSFSL